MREMGMKPKKPKTALAGEHYEKGIGNICATVRYNQMQKPSYLLGSLKQAREAFTKATGLSIEWEAAIEGHPEEDGLVF
jgi:hypothetical protein